MARHTMVEIEIKEVARHTPKALLVRTEDGTESWIPVSQVREFEGMLPEEWEDELDDLEVITIPEWSAVQKGLV